MILQMFYRLMNPAIRHITRDNSPTQLKHPAPRARGRLLLSVQSFPRKLRFTNINMTIALVSMLSFSTGHSVHADDLPEPTGEILLTISGNIQNANHPDGAAFDLDMLEAMESTTIETKTPWTEGVTRFTGVLLDQLLEAAGTESRMLKMSAEDGYIYEPLKPMDSKYPIIVAYKKDGEYMSLRQLGPLWVMYPFDDYPELNTEENRAACVWQLKHMEVK
jgi:hypothetical protein